MGLGMELWKEPAVKGEIGKRDVRITILIIHIKDTCLSAAYRGVWCRSRSRIRRRVRSTGG